MAKIKVGIIMGGPSAEHEVSLASGENVLKNLDFQIFEPVKIRILRDGKVWVNGCFSKLEKAVKSVDVCFLATHGEFGEDGRLQAVLDSFGVSYTGSAILSSALAMNKAKSRQLLISAGLKAPKTLLIKEGTNYKTQLNFFISKVTKLPVVVKPCSRGSSVGVSIIENKRFLNKAIREAFKYDPEVLVEEYIHGREFSCGVVDLPELPDLRNPKITRANGLVALPVTEIIPGPEYKFFSYQAKYTPQATKEITPARISPELAKEIQTAAIKAHEILDCKDYSRVDLKVKNGKIYIFELNTLPGLTENSLLPRQLKAAGLSLEEFLIAVCVRNLKQHENTMA